MKRRSTALLVLGIAIGPRGASPAIAWGCKGHQTVALLAVKHLTPTARQTLSSLLSSNPIDLHLRRYCGSASSDPFADASTWADDERAINRATGPWHYIDIPLGASREQIQSSCGKEGCIIRAIEEQLAILKDKTAPGTKRADALRYIIHFVGDLHQPLHTATNADRGGNCIPVQYFSRIPRATANSYSPNLHQLWDTAILERQMEGADPAEYAAKLEAMYASSFAGWQQGGMQLDEWAWEGFQDAVETTYGALSKRITVEPNVAVATCADDDHIGERMLRKHLVVGQTYQEEAAALINERIAQAGIRLAMILNDAAR